MVSSIYLSFILQVLQDRLMLPIGRVTQLTILASSRCVIGYAYLALAYRGKLYILVHQQQQQQKDYFTYIFFKPL